MTLLIGMIINWEYSKAENLIFYLVNKYKQLIIAINLIGNSYENKLQ